jgi:peptidoglycan-associated lipoprotein
MFYFNVISSALFSLFFLTGCSQTTANPDVSASDKAASSAVSAKAGADSGEGRSGALSESDLAAAAKAKQKKEAEAKSPPASSLDRLKDGQSTATSASDPLKDVYFDFDRYDLKTEARDILKTNVEWIKKNPPVAIEIEGHCDERGTSEYNLALGAKRAQVVRDYLVAAGISADRITSISYGEEIPACTEQSESCWAQNRRARFVVQPRPAS